MASTQVLSPRVSSPAAANEVNYEKLINLFTSSHSSELYDRHVGVVERVCRVNTKGFPIRDLPYVEQILRFLITKIQEGLADVFAESLCKLLRVLALPFIRRTATDEFKMFNNISTICSAVSSAFSPSVPNSCQIAAAEMLGEFACAYGSRPSCVDEMDAGGVSGSRGGPSPRQYHTNQGLMERAPGCIATIVKNGFVLALEAQGPQVDAKLQLALTHALLQISYNAANADLMLRAGILRPLCRALSQDFRSLVAFSAVELAWNLLDNCDAAAYLARDFTVLGPFCQALAAQLEALLDRGFKLADKELRNEILLLASMLARQDAARDQLREAGFLKLALAISTSPELPPRQGGINLKPFTQTKESEDFEMKRVAWGVVCEACANEDCKQQAMKAGFLEALLLYLRPDAARSSPALTRWSRSQLHTLTLQVLSILYRLVPNSHAEFSALQGSELLLAFVKSLDPDTQGDLRSSALRLLRRAAATPQFTQELGEKGAIAITLELFVNSENPEVLRNDAISTVSLLCQDNPANQHIFKQDKGLSAIKNALAALRSADHTLPSAFAAAIVDCVWNAVIANRRNLARFLAGQGMDVMLDLLEVCNPYLYPVLLSCLSDIALNRKTHDFFHEWRSGKTNCTAAHMLLSFWRAEENTRAMTDRDGCIAHTARPMAGTVKERVDWKPSLDVAYTFQSADKRGVMAKMSQVVTGDAICTKIYAVFVNLGFTNFNYLEPKDRSTLAAIEKYVKFRQGEVWQDISAEFIEEKMKPTAADRHRLTSGIYKAEAVAREVVTVQRALHGVHNQNHEKENQVFYESTIRLAKDEAEEKIYKRDMTTLTMKERLEAKLKKEQMLKVSFREDQTKHNFKTLMGVDYGED